MSSEFAFMGVEAANATRGAQTLRRLRRAMNVHSAYHRLFVGEDGQLRPDALLVIGDIVRVAGIGTIVPNQSGAQLREREGRRMLGLHILARIDLSGEQMRELAQKERELNR
ncbi:hypothetical protein ACFQ15_05735 [Sphingomonas hankookensis]|uniref:Bbp19 family protein n=1 Tax=Sphingomonas hankookensis TaxID=563996 RepID=UPI001F5972B3|nr:hypothetical protein [Sphingomonas hankookensis]